MAGRHHEIRQTSENVLHPNDAVWRENVPITWWATNGAFHMKNAILFRSVAEPEPPLEEWSRSRFFCWLGPRAGAAFFKAAPALTESFWQAKKESLVVVTKRDLKAIYIMVNVIRKKFTF